MLELLITMAILSVITGAVLTLFRQSQESYNFQTRQADTLQKMRLAMDQISRSLRQAGNDPLEQFETPAIQIQGTGVVQIQSDFSGSESTPSGEVMTDPDGSLTDDFENVVYRHDATAKKIYVNYGRGEGVLADGIQILNFSTYDIWGNLTTVPSEIVRVKIYMVGEVLESSSGEEQWRTLTLESDVNLRNLAPQILPSGGSSE